MRKLVSLKKRVIEYFKTTVYNTRIMKPKHSRIITVLGEFPDPETHLVYKLECFLPQDGFHAYVFRWWDDCTQYGLPSKYNTRFKLSVADYTLSEHNLKLICPICFQEVFAQHIELQYIRTLYTGERYYECDRCCYDYVPVYEIDYRMRPLLKLLWKQSIRTSYCCAGHYQRDTGYISFPYQQPHYSLFSHIQNICKSEKYSYLTIREDNRFSVYFPYTTSHQFLHDFYCDIINYCN